MPKKDWDVVAQLDPLWGILSEPKKKFRKWDINEFFLSGKNEVEYLMHCVKKLGYPQYLDSALDFGCGVGRITMPLSKYFRRCYGLDISELMIEKAKAFSKGATQASEIVYSNDTNLEQFPDETFDLVYSIFVLQHLPQRYMLKDQIKEFLRVLKRNGLLVFQVPNFIPFLNRFRIGLTLYRILAVAGLSKETLYNTYGLLPVTMNYLKDKDVRELLISHQGKLLDFRFGPNSGGVKIATYYVTK